MSKSKLIYKRYKMKLKVKKEFILPLLSQVQTLLEKRAALPVFSNICIKPQGQNRAVIYASDSELSFSAFFPCEIDEKSSFALNGKNFYEIVRELKDGFFELISSENFNLEIKQDRSKFKVHGLNPNDFPAFPHLKKKNKQTLKAGEFLDIIEKTLYCVSGDESRYHLTGVFLEQLSSSFRFVATDGHRMSFLDIKTDIKKEKIKDSIIIPKKALQELKKMLSQGGDQDIVDFFIEKPSLLVQFKNQELNTRLIEGKYPDYKQLIPKQEGKKIQVEKELFLSALKRISVLTSARFKGINFSFKKNKMALYFSHPESGEAFEELDCQYSGEELKVRFNSQYILDILHSIREDKVEISLLDNRSPGLIRPEGKSSYTCLVMPMKL